MASFPETYNDPKNQSADIDEGTPARDARKEILSKKPSVRHFKLTAKLKGTKKMFTRCPVRCRMTVDR